MIHDDNKKRNPFVRRNNLLSAYELIKRFWNIPKDADSRAEMIKIFYPDKEVPANQLDGFAPDLYNNSNTLMGKLEPHEHKTVSLLYQMKVAIEHQEYRQAETIRKYISGAQSGIKDQWVLRNIAPDIASLEKKLQTGIKREQRIATATPDEKEVLQNMYKLEDMLAQKKYDADKAFELDELVCIKINNGNFPQAAKQEFCTEYTRIKAPQKMEYLF